MCFFVVDVEQVASFNFVRELVDIMFEKHTVSDYHMMHLRKVCPPGARNCQFSRAGMALGKHDKLAPRS